MRTLDSENNRAKGISSFLEGLLAPKRMKHVFESSYSNEPASSYSNMYSNGRTSATTGGFLTHPSMDYFQSDMHAKDEYGARMPPKRYKYADESFSFREPPSSYSNMYSNGRPSATTGGFLKQPSLDRFQSVDINARDEYRAFLMSLNNGRNASPFDRFSTPILPARHVRQSITPLLRSSNQVRQPFTDSITEKVEKALAMLRNLPTSLKNDQSIVKGEKHIGEKSAFSKYEFLNSAPSPRASYSSDLRTKKPPQVIDLTGQLYDKAISSALRTPPTEQKNRTFTKEDLQTAASFSPSPSLSNRTPQSQKRKFMDDTTQSWHQRKYMDEEEMRLNKIRDLEEEVSLRSKARGNREIYSVENRRTKLRAEGLILERRVPEKEEFPELPEDAIELLNKVWNRSGPQNEVFSKGFGVDILRKDLLSLRGLEWLNDEVINFYMSLICERSQKDAKLPKTYAFNTFFFVNLSTKGFASIKRWTRKVDIFSFDLLIIPVHLTAHWCLATVDFKQKCISYYDSLLGENKRCLSLIKEYLQQEYSDKKKGELDMSGWTTVCRKDIPQQLNGSDCGMFSCKFAEYASRCAPISFNQTHMPYFRQRMVYEISTKNLL